MQTLLFTALPTVVHCHKFIYDHVGSKTVCVVLFCQRGSKGGTTQGYDENSDFTNEGCRFARSLVSLLPFYLRG